MRGGLLLLAALAANGQATLLLEEPYGMFGGMNPTGHAAIYLSRVCAGTPVHLRRCLPGETGVVISRYHRVGGYDWIAIPLIPYLYAVDNPDQVLDKPASIEVDSLRDEYRRTHLEDLAPDLKDGATPDGDWTQLVGEAYDRTIYGFRVETTEEKDDALIALLNSRSNKVQFHLLFHNCADFVRQIMDFYYPHAVHRNFSSDLGIMTPKQAAKSLIHYARKHPDLDFSSFTIAQVAGPLPRSSAVRGVVESLVKSKRYAVPLASLAVLHPVVGGGLAYAFVEGSRFDPKREASGARILQPSAIINQLR